MNKRKHRESNRTKRTKLTVRKETVLNLTSEMLKNIAGGRFTGSDDTQCDSLAEGGCGI